MANNQPKNVEERLKSIRVNGVGLSMNAFDVLDLLTDEQISNMMEREIEKSIMEDGGDE